MRSIQLYDKKPTRHLFLTESNSSLALAHAVCASDLKNRQPGFLFTSMNREVGIMYPLSCDIRQRLTCDLHPVVHRQDWTECRRQGVHKAAWTVGLLLVNQAPKARQNFSSCAHHIPTDDLHVDGKHAKNSGVLTRMVWLGFAMLSPLRVDALGIGGTDAVSAWTYSGWACDPATPGYQSEVHAKRDDGEFLGRIIAADPRDAALPTVCGSPHNAHGFQLYIEQKAKWADGKSHDVTLYSVDPAGNATAFKTLSVQFPSSTDGIPPPQAAGAVVGRDLDYKIADFIGHIGIWDGSRVIEMLNDKNSISKVFRNSWDNFKSRSNVWNTAHPKYPGHKIKTCWSHVCDVNSGRTDKLVVSAQQAVVLRATQIYMIGADYTLSAFPTIAEPEMRDYTDSRWKRNAIKGKYRCDTFVYDAFRASTDLDNTGIHPYRYIYNMDASWRNKVSSLHGYSSLILPAAMMEKIRNF